MASSRFFTIGNHWQGFSEVEGGAGIAADHAGRMKGMEAEEREELRDLAEAWAGWWHAYGSRGYVGGVLPPLRRTERLLGRRGLVAVAFRRRRRERVGQPALPLG